MSENKSNWLLLLFGIFSMTQFQFIGSIGISEIVAYIAAPVVFVCNAKKLQEDGFMPVLVLSFMVILGCMLSSWHNHTAFPFALRGVAQIYSLFAYPVILHALLRNNLRGVRLLMLGYAISMTINVFVFRQSVEVSMLSHGIEDEHTTEMIMSGPLFWLKRMGSYLMLPMQGWYFQTPTLFSIFSIVAMSIFSFATADSGRSATMYSLMAAGLVLLAGRSVRRMLLVQRHLLVLLSVAVVMVLGMKVGYNYLASHELLNDKAQRKYENQTKVGSGLAQIIMSGRGETFAGFMACLDEPIWGFGPWSLDERGYFADFVARFGDYNDYEEYVKQYNTARINGISPYMPSHSHIVGFWVRYGILGLPYWLYILYCMYRHFRYNMAAIPQWFGMMAVWLASNIWHIAFSPYGNRFNDMLFVTCLLLCEAVRKGKIDLPFEMRQEAMKHF